MAENQAAWLTEAGAYPFAVNDGPKPTPGPGEIIIKNAAVAIALAAAIPDNLSFEQAVVLPLAISTACAGLYQKEYLNLPDC
ncbi:zinc-binding oxidoreductase CipB [Penicillium soppii]|uniref:zinc-binding oxidoreductase CipB n=1 Tax=Penicillium soppii TaxID=69789 RepID=UPI002547777E|nr:zinc-binding oxidoreductase CipB [Penicillium soppii]KAJ5860305.1 zinc-binding oxidoreductase CipB [Penicillium soppii]